LRTWDLLGEEVNQEVNGVDGVIGLEAVGLKAINHCIL
jgi:hypothetical protein